MEFLKKHWLSVIIIVVLAYMVWHLYNKNQKNAAALKAATGGAPEIVTDFAEGGYDGSGIAAGVQNMM